MEKKGKVTITGFTLILPGVVIPEFGHTYTVKSTVCADGSGVSDNKLRQAMRKAVVPRQNPVEAVNGRTYTVTDPRFGFPGGIVRTFVSADGFGGRNVTTAMHALHSGTVNREVSRNADSSISASTVGVGTNVYAGFITAPLNAWQGPEVFEAVDRQLADSLREASAACAF